LKKLKTDLCGRGLLEFCWCVYQKLHLLAQNIVKNNKPIAIPMKVVLILSFFRLSAAIITLPKVPANDKIQAKGHPNSKGIIVSSRNFYFILRYFITRTFI
jgi:hypothetical protein